MKTAKTILLTGATGFLGSHLLEALLKKRYKVVILKRSCSNTWRIQHLLHQVTSYDADTQPLEMVFEQQHIDAVIHTACQYGRNGEPIHQIVESNLMFGLHLLDACTRFNTNTFFNTDTLLQKNLNTYTLSKKQFVAWLKLQSEKIQIVNLRLEHMYGVRDDTTKFVPWVISKFNSNEPEIKLTLGEQQRDFIYIDDVVSAYLITLEKSSGLSAFNEFDVGTGQLLTVRSFLEKLKSSYDTMCSPTTTKLAFGSIPYRQGEMMSVEVNNKNLLALGWKPKTSLDKGFEYILKEVV